MRDVCTVWTGESTRMDEDFHDFAAADDRAKEMNAESAFDDHRFAANRGGCFGWVVMRNEMRVA